MHEENSEYEQKQAKNIKENELEMLKMGFVHVSTLTADFRDIYSDVLGTSFNYGVEMQLFLYLTC